MLRSILVKTGENALVFPQQIKITNSCRVNVSLIKTRYRATSEALAELGIQDESLTTDYTKIRVFAKKETKELMRSWLVLKLSSMRFIVNNSDSLITVGRKILPKQSFEKLMNLTFFKQFVIGENITNSLDVVDLMKTNGIRPMLCVPTETKIGLSELERELEYQSNYDIIKECCDGTAHVDPGGFAQAKITAMCDKELLIEMNKYLLEHEANHREPGDWSVERISAYLSKGEIGKIIMEDLSEENNGKLQDLFIKLDDLAKTCKDLDVRLMLDAEQTYIQAALGYVILVLQAKYNKDKPIVYNTYQCYRKDTLDRVKADLNLSSRLNFQIAGKLVRGAYMIEERQLAESAGVCDPINDTYNDTNKSYHSVVDLLLPLVVKNKTGVMVASHNEDTVDYVMKKMDEHGISKENPLLCFGQLYGMCDHVSYYLGMNGYQILKSAPYGLIDDCLLYLARRAHENHSVMERTVLERSLIKKELLRRVAST